MFSIDFSTTAVALIIGDDLLLKHDDAADRIQIKYVSFYNPGSTSIKVLYCNREVKCYKDASHFWPFDKPNVADLITGKTLTSKMKHIKPGPTFYSITSAAFSLTNNKLNLGDFAGKCLSNPKLCTKGLTVAFWFNVAIASTGVQTLLSTDTTSPGIQIYFSNDEVHANVYDKTYKTYAKSTAKKGQWNHVTVTWTPTNQMVLMINFNSQTSGSTSPDQRLTDTNTILTIGAKNDLSGSADASISSLVIWEKSLDGHYIQKIGICTGFSPVPSLEEGNFSSIIVPYDSLTASSDVGNTILKGQLLYDDGTALSGAWQPSHTTPPTYFQLDFVMGMPLAKTATQGGNNLAQWVKSYTLSYSWDGQEWTDYKISGSVYHFTANSDSKNIVSHLLCPKIEARLIRFHPVTWNANIAMRVGLLVDGDAVDFKGCYSSASIDLTKPINDVNPDELHPGKCVTSCVFQNAKYAGLSHENRCYCFDTLPGNDVSRHKCNDPCNGDPSFKCGSLFYVNVYGVRESVDANFLISIPSKVKLLTPFKVTSSVHHRFSVDFGEGIILITNKSEISYFATNVNKRTVVADTWTSKYGTPKQRKSSKELEVQWYLNGSKISYDKVVEAGQSYAINITVNEGSELKILRTKSNGEQQSYSIPDAMVLTTLKLDSTLTTTTPGSNSQDRLFVLSNSVFNNNGILKAFTVHVLTPGFSVPCVSRETIPLTVIQLEHATPLYPYVLSRCPALAHPAPLEAYSAPLPAFAHRII
ncbi:uncharacterized protein LOC116303418 [Actinia tenebrosa]|uniref:Uncharacterized protein LOC116303418 n=1 Tax=Actinia tenebrosa TaxID=6105 RepID=A0A6P8IPI1_ACTTE|nr:uncharacterized protein LOC116303418 [Actinia tenebrosa]